MSKKHKPDMLQRARDWIDRHSTPLYPGPDRDEGRALVHALDATMSQIEELHRLEREIVARLHSHETVLLGNALPRAGESGEGG